MYRLLHLVACCISGFFTGSCLGHIFLYFVEDPRPLHLQIAGVAFVLGTFGWGTVMYADAQKRRA